MKILKAIQGEPLLTKGNTSKGKNQKVYEAVIAARGKWVPIRCSTGKETKCLQIAAIGNRHHKFQSRSDISKLTVYLRVRDAKKS